jgi:hypothetical protein
VSLDERRERGRLLCGHLAADVVKLAPEGVGRWERAWEIVAAADADFILALAHWEATGLDADKPALRAAYFAVLDAWKRAATEYRSQLDTEKRRADR